MVHIVARTEGFQMKAGKVSVIVSLAVSILICCALAACGAAEERLRAENVSSEEVFDPSAESDAPAAPVDEPTVIPADVFSDEAETPEPSPADTETQPEPAEAPENSDPEEKSASPTAVDIAAEQLGVPYVAGGSSPDEGFDSSGFVYYCINQAGADFPRQIKSQLEAGEKIEYSELQPGDAVYFSQDEGGSASFCGIYAGGGLMIYSPVPDDFVKTANITTGYWTSRFVTGIRPN